ncbi:MAG: HEAT repeat domain-containing protein [Anaerolineae bacterium]
MEEYRWEEFLRRLGKRGEPADFKAFMADHDARAPSIDPQMWAAMYPMIVADNVGKTMLAAALQLPAAEAERTLDQIAGVLPRARFRKRLNKELTRQQREWHQTAIRVIRHQVVLGTAALVATFRAYIRGDYDLGQDPNNLIREANRLVDQDPDRALELVGQAGALALRGKELWDRWSEEAKPPVASWTLVLYGVIDHFAHYEDIYPLAAIENERPRWADTLRALEGKPKPEADEEEDVETVGLEYLDSLFDDLEPFLYADGPPTAQELATLPRAPEEYVDFLIHSVRKWDTWDLSEPSTELLLTNMIAILGEFRAEEAVDAFIDIVANTIGDELFGMAEAASNALAIIGEPALGPMLDFVRYSDNDAARVELALPLAQVGRGDPQAYETLVQFFEEVDWEVDEWETGKANVAYALGQLGDQRAVQVLRAALSDPAADDYDRELIETALDDLGAQSG